MKQVAFLLLMLLSGSALAQYYDNYSFVNGDPYFAYKWTTLEGQYQFTSGGHDAFPGVTGQVTGTWIRTLAKDRQWMRTVNYYDDKYRMIQSITDNHKRGQDVTTNVYDFTGKVLANRTGSTGHHITWGSSNGAGITEDRLKNNLGGGATPWAFSSQQIAAGADGWVEYTVSPMTTAGTARTFGFSTSTSATNVGWGLKVDIMNGAAFSLATENGVNKNFPGVTVLAGDVMRVERRGMTMRYSRNGVVVYTVRSPQRRHCTHMDC